MTDEDFLRAALAELSPETRAGALACASAQVALPHRMTPGEAMDIADALSAPRGLVLALMGWINSKADRPNRRAFFDILCPTLSRSEARWPTDRETLFALGICRTLQ
ncbi:hypothetical protein ABVF61_26850 [Roseibium sp. HPY-6]|uniref:hypothetical protein n=1 Tax=Roseibium sp. HPY-6 TaxID=3229852 RepID=UPI00339023C5